MQTISEFPIQCYTLLVTAESDDPEAVFLCTEKQFRASAAQHKAQWLSGQFAGVGGIRPGGVTPCRIAEE